MPSKYDKLKTYLLDSALPTVTLSFKELEKVLCFSLPSTAYRRPQWWSNEIGPTRHVQANAWMDAGFRVAEKDLDGLGSWVRFARV
jgi:hypothetical protein